MAEFLLSIVVQELLNKAISLASSEIGLVQSSKKELTRLSETLTMIRAVLDDAERRQVSEDAVKIWLKKLKDVAYEADNVLDEVGYEILRHKVEIQNQTKKKVRFFFSSANPIVFRLGLSHKIKAINSSLKNVNQEANDFGLLRRIIIDINTHDKVHVQRESDSFVNYSEIIGRDDEVSEIVKLMIGSRDQEKLSVIPIVGMGGIGKTTLAKLLYNDERVKMNFDARVWVCVSHQFDVKRLLLEILESCREIKCEIRRRDDILGNLEKELRGKKYLLFLDDVWNEDIIAWEDFRSCLLGINTIMGNKIVVTTRSTRVGSIMGTHQAHHLEGLTDDSCWSIFKERAFAAGGAPMTRDLVDIGTEIVRKCRGVPLAAMVMGSLMSSKREIQEWLAIRNSGVWSLEGEESEVLRVLKLSFDHLPSSSVKKCFSYCSIFPKDYDVEKKQIIQLWMAVGFLQSNHKGKVMEDIGEEFFSILVQNSLLQDIRKDKYNNITNCRMHDLVHDLALSVSGSEIFNSNATLGNDFAKARHLALYSGEEIMCEISKERARCLQTLFSSINVAKNILVSFKCLRVLNFYAADIEELPNSVSKLVYLRYLDLSYTPIMVLPEGISKLYNLQTLRLNNCRSLKLKDELRNLVSLRHLYLPAYDHGGVIMPLGIGL